MAQELAVIERQLQPLMPRFDALLRGSIMDAKSLIQMVLVAVERAPRVAECTPQSIINATNTAAVLHLPIDGATGQFFLLPFRDRGKGVTIAQPAIGYRGFNTIAARGGLTINGGVVREGDLEWDYREGTGGFVRHKKRLDNKGRIIAAWAVAESKDRPNAVSVLGIGEIEGVMARSPAVRGGAETPWNDPIIGFPAMSEKTAKRRLSRSIPWQIDEGRFLTAARVEEAFDEQGRYSYARGPGDVVVEGPVAASEDNATPAASALMAPMAPEDPVLESAKADGREAAEGGTGTLKTWWVRLAPPLQAALRDFKEELKPMAERVDRGEAA